MRRDLVASPPQKNKPRDARRCRRERHLGCDLHGEIGVHADHEQGDQRHVDPSKSRKGRPGRYAFRCFEIGPRPSEGVVRSPHKCPPRGRAPRGEQDPVAQHLRLPRRALARKKAWPLRRAGTVGQTDTRRNVAAGVGCVMCPNYLPAEPRTGGPPPCDPHTNDGLAVLVVPAFPCHTRRVVPGQPLTRGSFLYDGRNVALQRCLTVRLAGSNDRGLERAAKRLSRA